MYNMYNYVYIYTHTHVTFDGCFACSIQKCEAHLALGCLQPTLPEFHLGKPQMFLENHRETSENLERLGTWRKNTLHTASNDSFHKTSSSAK